MQRLRFTGAIAGVGSTSGVRFVVGRWTESPLGSFADVMVEDATGHRVLIAPRQQVADFVASTYSFDEVRVEPVSVELAFWDTVKESDNPAMYAAYLEQYPEGSFAALAKVRLEELPPAA